MPETPDMESWDSLQESSTTVVRERSGWVVEHEPESDAYLLVDASGAYCADLHWNAQGECWALFESYVAFLGPTTIADIEALQELALLLRELPRPEGRVAKEPRKTGNL